MVARKTPRLDSSPDSATLSAERESAARCEQVRDFSLHSSDAHGIRRATDPPTGPRSLPTATNWSPLIARQEARLTAEGISTSAPATKCGIPITDLSVRS